MADRNHLLVLGRGVKVWNRWRKERTEIKPDLKRASMREAALLKAMLKGAHLMESDLRGANLFRADLREADLCGADLREADLSEVVFHGADFWTANLEGADLRNANLRKSVNLTVEQLSTARTLYRAKLDLDLLVRLGDEFSHLFHEPVEDPEDKGGEP